MVGESPHTQLKGLIRLKAVMVYRSFELGFIYVPYVLYNNSTLYPHRPPDLHEPT